MSWPYGNVEREKYRGKTNLFFLKGSACTLWDVAQFRPVPTVSFRQKILSLLCNSLSCCEQEKHHTWRKTGFLTACFKLSNLLTWTSVEQLCILAQLHIFLMKKSFGKHLLFTPQTVGQQEGWRNVMGTVLTYLCSLAFDGLINICPLTVELQSIHFRIPSLEVTFILRIYWNTK